MSVAPASRLTGHAAALAETHLLRGLPEDQLLELAPLFFRRELPAGVTLFREGDPGRSMLILHSGAVEVARRLPGRELALAAVGATEALGEMALVSGQPRSTTVRTGTLVRQGCRPVRRRCPPRCSSSLGRGRARRRSACCAS